LSSVGGIKRPREAALGYTHKLVFSSEDPDAMARIIFNR
jgi:hypothetical protein